MTFGKGLKSLLVAGLVATSFTTAATAQDITLRATANSNGPGS